MNNTLAGSAAVQDVRPHVLPIAAARPLTDPSLPVRFQVVPVRWGDRRRYEVIDTWTRTTLVVRATRQGADDDVIVLNMGARGGPSVRGCPDPGGEE